MSEDDDSSSIRLPYTVPNLSHLPDDPSSTEDEFLASLPPVPKRFSSRASASPYRTADRIPASQRLQLAQGRTRSNLGTIHEEATSKKKPSSRSRLLPSRETVSQQSSLPTEDCGQDRESTVSSIGEVANNFTHRNASATVTPTPPQVTTTNNNESPVVCAICQESIPNIQKYFLPCFHVFHQECIDDCFDCIEPTNPKRCTTCRFIVHPAQSGVVDMTMNDTSDYAETRSNVAPRSYTIPSLASILNETTVRTNETTVRPSNTVTNRCPDVTTTTHSTVTVNSARAPRRRPAPSSTATEQAVKRKSTTFTQSQIDLLLDLCDEIKPLGEQGWKQVTERFVLRYPNSNKTWKGLRQKFNKLANVRYV